MEGAPVGKEGIIWAATTKGNTESEPRYNEDPDSTSVLQQHWMTGSVNTRRRLHIFFPFRGSLDLVSSWRQYGRTEKGVDNTETLDKHESGDKCHQREVALTDFPSTLSPQSSQERNVRQTPEGGPATDYVTELLKTFKVIRNKESPIKCRNKEVCA